MNTKNNFYHFYRLKHDLKRSYILTLNSVDNYNVESITLSLHQKYIHKLGMITRIPNEFSAKRSHLQKCILAFPPIRSIYMALIPNKKTFSNEFIF